MSDERANSGSSGSRNELSGKSVEGSADREGGFGQRRSQSYMGANGVSQLRSGAGSVGTIGSAAESRPIGSVSSLGGALSPNRSRASVSSNGSGMPGNGSGTGAGRTSAGMSGNSPGAGRAGTGAAGNGAGVGRAGAVSDLPSRTAAAQEDDDDDEYDDDYEEERRFPQWARVLFWLFRKSIVPVIMVVMLAAGLYIGYVIVGDQSKDDVFEWSTWRHLYDLIFADS